MIEYVLTSWPYSRWPNFTWEEFRCSHSGKCWMHPTFMDLLQLIRNEVGFSMPVTSGYRHRTHPAEASKEKPGAHTLGVAADIKIAHGGQGYAIMVAALTNNRMSGIGIRLTGDRDKRFIHLDAAGYLCKFHASRPAIWGY